MKDVTKTIKQKPLKKPTKEQVKLIKKNLIKFKVLKKRFEANR